MNFERDLVDVFARDIQQRCISEVVELANEETAN